ncbi:ATPase AAA [Streptomyces griseus]|uniref:ATPase AAA n=1 Tax=Streptomyces griseus TaxID=1911 RepID=UPI00055C03D1|nr:ATPase AAA [Streptomyces griseus]
MDPNTRGPEEYGHEGDGHTPRPRPPRDPLTPDFGQSAPSLARTVQLVCGEHLLTVNPVDGSEIELCPPSERPGRPEKLTEAARAEAARAAKPPVPPGPAQPALPLLGRQDEREQLVRLLARGRSVCLTGPAGSGRTSLLDIVAEDCADLAPDGVIRLGGFHRTASDLLHDLFYAAYDAPLYRPERDELLTLVREIGAVVVVDDLEFGGAGLDELLDATPECAFLFAATPDAPAPSADAAVEEVLLGGLDRAGGVDLIERVAGRALTEEESNWAGDLWFESEGLPLRFLQAGALLSQRDQRRADAAAVDEFGVFEDARPDDAAVDAPFDIDAEDGERIPLPSLGEAAAPAPLLAARLSDSARSTLRFALALDGEVPHQAHLPALVGDTHADAALGELAACGLVTPVGSRYRLAAGVPAQLVAAGYGDDIEERALAAAQHYTWWAGHPSVTPERVCAEADALLAALGVLVPLTSPADADAGENIAVQLARTAAPAFAAGLHWSAWERALRAGAEASRLAGEVAEQAYFHHELGILALCEGQLDRARAELEASIGLRGALADKRGTVAGRRALALVADRMGDVPGLAAAMAGEEVPDARSEESASPAGGVPAALSAFPQLQPPSGDTLVTHQLSAPPGPSVQPGPSGAPPRHGRGGLTGLVRRNLVAVGAGTLLAAVLGTVVTLGATSDNDANPPSDKVRVNPSASQDVEDGSLGADVPKQDAGNGDADKVTSRPTDPGPDGTFGTTDDPTPTQATEPSDKPSGTRGTESPSSPSPSRTTPKPTSPKPPSSPSPSAPSSPTDTSPDPTDSGTTPPATSPSQTPPSTNTAGGSTDTDTPSNTTAGAPRSTDGTPTHSDPVI